VLQRAAHSPHNPHPFPDRAFVPSLRRRLRVTPARRHRLCAALLAVLLAAQSLVFAAHGVTHLHRAVQAVALDDGGDGSPARAPQLDDGCALCAASAQAGHALVAIGPVMAPPGASAVVPASRPQATPFAPRPPPRSRGPPLPVRFA